MRKVREMYRLHHEAGLSARKIARALNVTHTVVNNYLKRFKDASLDQEMMASCSDSELEKHLFPPTPATPVYPVPDWAVVHQELRKKGVSFSYCMRSMPTIIPTAIMATPGLPNAIKPMHAD